MLEVEDLLETISCSGRFTNIQAISAAGTRGAVVLNFTDCPTDTPARLRTDHSAYISSNKCGIVGSSHNPM